MENYLFISKSIDFNLPSIFNHWFTFSSDSHNFETCRSSKGLLNARTVNIKKYGREAMINNAISSWKLFKRLFDPMYYNTHVYNSSISIGSISFFYVLRHTRLQLFNKNWIYFFFVIF